MTDPKHTDAVARRLREAAAAFAAADRYAQSAHVILDSSDPAVHAAMLDALTRHGVLSEERPTDGSRPHKFPSSAIGKEVIAWTCQACGEVIREYESRKPGECAVDWRDTGKRRLVTSWEMSA